MRIPAPMAAIRMRIILQQGLILCGECSLTYGLTTPENWQTSSKGAQVVKICKWKIPSMLD